MGLRVVGLCLSHPHLSTNLSWARDHPDAEIVAIADEEPDRRVLHLADTAEAFDLDDDQVFEDADRCLAATEPDIVVLCPVPVAHVDWLTRVVDVGANVLLEKPYAESQASADRLVHLSRDGPSTVIGSWPLAWEPVHRTTKRLIDDGVIGDVTEVHYYDGNVGSPRFANLTFTDDAELIPVDGQEQFHPDSWWCDPSLGGGSLIDYLGYGAVIGTWFRDGELPDRVSTRAFDPGELPVDTRSVTIAEYETGLSTFQTSWESFTDPWEHQPQPQCGFVIDGTKGTIASYDYASSVAVQDESAPEGYEVPADEFESQAANPFEYLVDRVLSGREVGFEPASLVEWRNAHRLVLAARRSLRSETPVSL